MGDSTTETTVKTGELSAQGEEWQSLLKGMITSNLEEQGYKLNPKQVTKYADQGKYDNLSKKITDYQTQMADIDKKIAEKPARAGAFDPHAPLQAEKARIQSQIQLTEDQRSKIKSTTYTDYGIEKLPDIRVQDAIDKYGAESPQAIDAAKMVKQEKVDQAASLADVNKNYLKSLQKLVSGDYSYTPEQKDQIDKYFAPIKDVIMDSTTKLLNQVGDDDMALGAKLNDISNQIDKTGFKVGDALAAASIQMDKNKTGLLDTLKAVNDSTSAKYKFQQDLMFQQIDKQTAQQAAMLGLPPGSQLEQYQRNKMKVDASTQLSLELNAREAAGAMGIEQQSAQDKKQIAFSYVALAESQGAKQEDVAKAAYDLSTQTFGKKEGILGMQQSALTQMEQQRQAQLMSAAFGGLNNQISAGSGGLAFQQNMLGQTQNRQISGMAPVTQQLGVEQQRTFAETDTTERKSGGFLSSLGSILGMAAGAAGTTMSGIGSMGMSTAAQGLMKAQSGYFDRQ